MKSIAATRSRGLMHAHTYTHTHTHIHTHIKTQTHAHTHARTHTHTHMHVRTHAHKERKERLTNKILQSQSIKKQNKTKTKKPHRPYSLSDALVSA